MREEKTVAKVILIDSIIKSLKSKPPIFLERIINKRITFKIIAEEKEAARNQTGNLSTITNTTLKMVFIAMVTMLIKKGVFVSKKA